MNVPPIWPIPENQSRSDRTNRDSLHPKHRSDARIEASKRKRLQSIKDREQESSRERRNNSEDQSEEDSLQTSTTFEIESPTGDQLEDNPSEGPSTPEPPTSSTTRVRPESLPEELIEALREGRNTLASNLRRLSRSSGANSANKNKTPVGRKSVGIPATLRILLNHYQKQTAEMATRTSMPLPGTKDAPSTFTGKDPDLLERYFDHVEQLLKSCNITDEQEKKKYLVKYTSPSVEREWKGLDRYDSGFTYDEFKEDILDSYLETRDASMGVYQRLTDLNQRYRGLGINEGGRVFDYIRGFRATGKELLGKNKMTSRELVTEFLATLEPTFRHSLTVRLGSAKQMKEAIEAQRARLEALEASAAAGAAAGQPAVPIQPAVAPRFKRQPVEYDLDEVLNEAKLLATEYRNNGGTCAKSCMPRGTVQ